jgi:hypothetical protein
VETLIEHITGAGDAVSDRLALAETAGEVR